MLARNIACCIPLLLVATQGCVTPVIPLPPPRVEDMTLALGGPQKDQATLSGPPSNAYQGIYVLVLNHNTGKGVITQAGVDGSFKTDPFVARDKDRLDVWTARGPDDQTSDAACGIVDAANGRLQRCH